MYTVYKDEINSSSAHLNLHLYAYDIDKGDQLILRLVIVNIKLTVSERIILSSAPQHQYYVCSTGCQTIDVVIMNEQIKQNIAVEMRSLFSYITTIVSNT